MNQRDEPAFPFQCQGPTTAPEIYYGLSIRDWFAGMALQGLLAANPQATPNMTEDNVDRLIANECYKTADAMLKARNEA